MAVRGEWIEWRLRDLKLFYNYFCTQICVKEEVRKLVLPPHPSRRPLSLSTSLSRENFSNFFLQVFWKLTKFFNFNHFVFNDIFFPLLVGGENFPALSSLYAVYSCHSDDPKHMDIMEEKFRSSLEFQVENFSFSDHRLIVVSISLFSISMKLWQWKRTKGCLLPFYCCL